jgi:hypothetical protein
MANVILACAANSTGLDFYVSGRHSFHDLLWTRQRESAKQFATPDEARGWLAQRGHAGVGLRVLYA